MLSKLMETPRFLRHLLAKYFQSYREKKQFLELGILIANS